MLSLSETVLERVAAAEDVAPAELEPPLYDVIDPDGLERLFKSVAGGPTRDTGTVQFEYCGYRVTVEAAGDVSLRDLNDL